MNGRNLLLVCSTLAAVVLWASPSRAQHGSGVVVHVGAVVASNSGRTFDSRLASMRRQFKSLFPYTSYRLIKDKHRSVRWGERAGFDLPGGCYVLVVPREFKEGRVSLKLVLIRNARPLLDTVLAIRNRGTLLIGGPHHQEGVLIISIGATRND